jgi:hypothetical protein
VQVSERGHWYYVGELARTLSAGVSLVVKAEDRVDGSMMDHFLPRWCRGSGDRRGFELVDSARRWAHRHENSAASWTLGKGSRPGHIDSGRSSEFRESLRVASAMYSRWRSVQRLRSIQRLDYAMLDRDI